ncbi:hypothetical protein SDJN02_26653, partial [Cucurbita argyrosperma subsp. argyrosperma]
MVPRQDSSSESLQTKSQVQMPESIPIPQFPHHSSSSSSFLPPCILVRTQSCYCSHFHSPSELAGSPSASQPKCLKKCLTEIFDVIFDYLRKISCYCEANTLLRQSPVDYSYPMMVVSEVTSRTRLPGLFSAKSLATLRPATPPEQPMK